MPGPVEPAGPGCTVEWNLPALEAFEHSPDGPARPLCDALGKIVAEGAKRRALVRTGRMRSEITYEVTAGPGGLQVWVVSPATNPADGFPYPLVHEGRKVRDRRPHRSLRPALADISKITVPLSGGQP